MFEFVKTHLRNILLFGGLLIAVFVGYTYFTGDETGPPLVATTPAAAPAGGELLGLLLNLRSLRLDDSVFSNPVFRRLTNFGVEIPKEPLGRPNPFAPLPGGQGGGGPVISIGSVKR